MSKLSPMITLNFSSLLFSRYRNFRTFTSPRQAQFSSLAMDASGEIICASAQDTFEVFVWSMQTGRLLEVSELMSIVIKL